MASDLTECFNPRRWPISWRATEKRFFPVETPSVKVSWSSKCTCPDSGKNAWANTPFSPSKTYEHGLCWRVKNLQYENLIKIKETFFNDGPIARTQSRAREPASILAGKRYSSRHSTTQRECRCGFDKLCYISFTIYHHSSSIKILTLFTSLVKKCTQKLSGVSIFLENMATGRSVGSKKKT